MRKARVLIQPYRTIKAKYCVMSKDILRFGRPITLRIIFVCTVLASKNHNYARGLHERSKK